MHPIDKKNRILAGIIIGIALVISIFSITKNEYFGYAILIYGIAGMTNTIRIKLRLVFMAIIIAVGLAVLLLVEYLFQNDIILPTQSKLEQFALSFPISVVLMIIIYIIIYFYYSQLADTIINEKKYYQVISHFPHLICQKHFSRTQKYSMLSYKGIVCRIGKRCLRKKDILIAVKLVGLIGMVENGKTVSNNYYVTLWDHRRRKIRYGDYDVIEIHNCEEIKDYNYVISKIITFFYNELRRYKPLNEVNVKIIGNPDISENTIRMMHKHFLNVEYVNP